MRYSAAAMRSPSTDEAASVAEGEHNYQRGAGLLKAADDADTFEAGIAAIEAAAESRHPEALATLATIEAVGAGRPRDWDKAFDRLVQASAAGSERARGQLRLLSASATDDEDWSAMRSQIDLTALLGVPERSTFAERPRIRVIRGFATAAECLWIIERARAGMAPAMVWDSEARAGKLDPSRSNSALELRLPQMDVVTAIVRARISAATRLPEPIFEVPQLLQYAVGQEFKPHFDFLDPAKPGHAADLAHRGQRIATFLIYLNEEFEGGETQFPAAGLSYSGRTGDALFFANLRPDGQPDELTLHAGCPPTAGEKWVFSQWIRDRPPGP